MQSGGIRAPYLGKLRGYVVRFAGWLHAIDYAMAIADDESGAMHCIDRQIPAETMQRAVRMAQFFLNQFDALAPELGISDIPAVVAKVLELGEQVEVVKARDLTTRRWVGGAQAARDLLNSLPTKYQRGRILPSPRADQVWWTLRD